VTAIFESREQADAATEKLKIFAQPQRLMILSYLLRGESSVSDHRDKAREYVPVLIL